MTLIEINRAVELLNHSEKTNYAISKETGITETTISNYRKGKTRPTLANAKILLQLLENYRSLNNISIQSTTKPNFFMTPLVSKYAYTDYSESWADEEFIKRLPEYPFLSDHEDPKPENYMAFEVNGDSMNNGTNKSILDGDILLGMKMPLDILSEGKFEIGKNYIVVYRNGITIKNIPEFDPERKTVTLHSLNPLYSDRKLPVDDIFEIYSIVQIQRRANP